jgi:riboflavin synthase
VFTGLVEQIATVEEKTLSTLGEADSGENQARRFTFAVANDEYLSDVAIGESISVSGVCLTVVEFQSRSFTVQAVEETMRRTTLGLLQVGQKVNLERALRADARLGGHVMQGHVDAIGTITGVRPEGEGWWVTIEPPLELMRYLVGKGSVALDGISLTVANVAYSRFSVAIIPHTREVTTAGQWEPGVQVNIETDIIARYVERFMSWSTGGAPNVNL